MVYLIQDLTSEINRDNVKEHTVIAIYLPVHTRNESTRNKIATKRIPPWEMKMQQNMVFVA